MISAVDVNYMDETLAVAAAVVFKKFTDTSPVTQYTAQVTDFGDYIPGKFYQRELPCIVAVLEKIKERLDVVIIDGYVMLGDGRPGLGYHLWQHLDGQAAIIGVAKSQFSGAHPVTIIRGQSHRPLYITAQGMDQYVAAEHIIRMAGVYRIPSLIRHADRLAKEISRYIAS
jgi:deoxyribonuclease V